MNNPDGDESSERSEEFEVTVRELGYGLTDGLEWNDFGRRIERQVFMPWNDEIKTLRMLKKAEAGMNAAPDRRKQRLAF